MLRIILAVVFTLAIANALSVLAPAGYWFYLAELAVSCVGFTALLFVANDRKVAE